MPEHRNVPGGRHQQAEEHCNSCGFTRAIAAEEANRGAHRSGKIDLIDSQHVTIPLDELFNLDCYHVMLDKVPGLDRQEAIGQNRLWRYFSLL